MTSETSKKQAEATDPAGAQQRLAAEMIKQGQEQGMALTGPDGGRSHHGRPVGRGWGISGEDIWPHTSKHDQLLPVVLPNTTKSPPAMIA